MEVDVQGSRTKLVMHMIFVHVLTRNLDPVLARDGFTQGLVH